MRYDHKQNNVSKSLSTAYAAYDYARLLFEDIEVATPATDDRFYLAFAELKVNAKKQKRDFSIRLIKQLKAQFPEIFQQFSSMRAEVFFHPLTDGCSISFVTGFEGLRILVDEKGKMEISVLH